MPRVNEEYFVAEAAAEEVYNCASPEEYFGLVPIPKVLFWTLGLLVLFAIFAIHQIFVWLTTNPARAFHAAKIITQAASTAWNTLATVANAGIDVVNEVIPYWNVVAIHWIEPLVFTSLDVVSLVFSSRSGGVAQGYAGILTDEGSSAFQGHLCDGTPATNEWCAVQATYAQKLGIVEAEASNVIQNNTELVLSTAQARRLQQIDGSSLIGSIPIQPLLDIVEDIAGVVITVVAQTGDLFFHVAWTVLHEIAVILYNLVMILVKVLASVVMQIVSSGIIQNLLRIGLDIIVVLVIHVALPLLMAFIDVVMCIINFIMPGTWPEQLECGALTAPSQHRHSTVTAHACPIVPCFAVEQTCFQEDGDIGAEIFTTFSSIPIVAKQVVKVVEGLLNPSTGRRFGQAANGAADEEALGGADIDPGNVGSAAASTCAACFTCRVSCALLNPRLSSWPACGDLLDLPSVVATMCADSRAAGGVVAGACHF